MLPPVITVNNAMITNSIPLSNRVLNILFLLYSAVTSVSAIILLDSFYQFLFCKIRP